MPMGKWLLGHILADCQLNERQGLAPADPDAVFSRSQLQQAIVAMAAMKEDAEMEPVRWEYRVDSFDIMAISKHTMLHSYLQAAGTEGWELVSIGTGPTIFKRALKA